jgi:hypothetical protein
MMYGNIVPKRRARLETITIITNIFLPFLPIMSL